MLRIKSTHPESQGPFVIINKADFDEKIHEIYEEEESKVLDLEKASAKELKALLTTLEVAFDSKAKIEELRELAKKAQDAAPKE